MKMFTPPLGGTHSLDLIVFAEMEFHRSIAWSEERAFLPPAGAHPTMSRTD